MNKTELATDWLAEYLASGEPVPSEKVYEDGLRDGFSKATIVRARGRLPGHLRIDTPRDGYQGRTMWHLVRVGPAPEPQHGIRLIPVSDLVDLGRDFHGHWGKWTLDAGNLVLDYDTGRYEVNLEECLTSAQVLNWVFQVNGKNWAHEDTGCLPGLVNAIDDILHPQAALCSSGSGKRLARADVRKRVEAYVRQATA